MLRSSHQIFRNQAYPSPVGPKKSDLNQRMQVTLRSQQDMQFLCHSRRNYWKKYGGDQEGKKDTNDEFHYYV